MISFRYISFTIYYVFINLFIIKLNELTLESMSALFLSTLIFFYIIKFIEYNHLNEKIVQELNAIDSENIRNLE